AWGLAPYQPAGTGPAPAFITRTWRESVLPAVGKVLAGRGVLAVLGTYPHQDSGADHVLNRASIWRDEGWSFADKLDPTPAEIADTPPVRPGEVLSVFPFLGGKAAVLVCFSSEMPEVAARLKAEGVQLVLIPSDTEDEAGARRILRSASARAVELGAAVLVSPLTGRQGDWSSVGSSALFLPSQKGIADPERVGPRWSSGIRRADYGIPWAGILSLRARPPRDVEARPFLSPASPFQVRSEPAPVIP
ncbi:MAG TPA: nitrilase-related carbon-nitrogen hydrolase, partial [Elusimicrobiota bacterium]|nr:nitrilase-related carbon-nitrogen hydrolase [Elusimicrobiota bacterium]